MIGKQIHNYQVVEKIGEGAVGVVYKAEDTRLNRTAALKFLSTKSILDTASKERFLQEARAAAALNHPNIITVYEINEFEGQMYIAMEFVDGLTLQEKFISSTSTVDKPINTKDIIDIAVQTCQGLNSAHQKGIIHRDIKPQNIMVNNENRVKILDFGIAKLKKVKKLTQQYTILGTLCYMSPEQLNYEELDPRTDIWALGVVLFELITGQLPFNGDTPETILYSILNNEPEPMSKKRPDIPSQLEQVVKKALAKDRHKRCPDIRSMMKDLQALPERTEIEGRTIIQAPPSYSPKIDISIAMLPFTDLSPKQDQEYFCDGISEELVNVLTKIAALKVTSWPFVFQFKNKGTRLEEIRDRLNVQYILEGSVQKADNRLRITTKLINTADGCHVWSERFDRKMKDIFAIQDEITMAVVENLKVKLLGNREAKLGKRHTDNQEAYNLYLKGRYFWNRRYGGGLNKSIEYYEKSIREDEQYALPYVGIADSLNILGLYGFVPPGEALSKTKKAAKKALAIDDELSEAFASLGWINTFFEWDWDEAEKNFQRALDLNPNYATTHEWYALSLATRGQLEEAIARAKTALDLDPLSLIINSVLGLIYIFAHQYPEAEEHLDKTLEMDPNFLLAHIWLGEISLIKKKYPEAIERFQKAMAISSDMTYVLSNLGHTYGVSGQLSRAQGIIDTFDRISQKRYISFVQKAYVYIGLGQMDRAFELFEKAYQMRDPFCILFNTHPQFHRLYSDPRFKKLLKNIGLDECSIGEKKGQAE